MLCKKRRIDDYWNIDGSRDLSYPWTGFTQFTLLEEKPPDGYMWSAGRLTRGQLTSRTDHLWPELWTKLGRNAKLKEKHKWSDENRNSIMPEDYELFISLTLKTRSLRKPSRMFARNWKHRWLLLCLARQARKCKHRETRGKTNEIKSKLACILEASECTRLRMEESLPKYHEDHIAGKGDNSLQHKNLVLKFIPMPQAVKIPAAKAAVDKEWEKLEKILAWDVTKVRRKKEVIDEARTKGAKVHFASLMDICHLKNAELEAKHQKSTKVEVYSEATL